MERTAWGAAPRPSDRWRQGGLEMETGSPIVPEFNSWLEELVKGEGSDLHVKVGSPPMIRLPHGLIRLDRDPLGPIETQAIADGIVPQDRKATFAERGDVASINQREIGNDTEDFLAALRAALRQDPDVILIGEMRDTETVRAALQAAQTGHLVLSTLHTTDATETVNRVIDFFPPYQQKQIRLALAASLRG